MTPTASGFYYWFEPSYFRKYATDLRELFRIGSLVGIDDCCKTGLRSLKGRCHGNQFCLFNPHYDFFSPQWPMCNKLCVHSATTRSTVVSVTHEVNSRRVSLTTRPIHRDTDIPPQTFPRHSCATRYDKKCKCCTGHANQLIHQLTIINRRRGSGGLQSRFALHLVLFDFLDNARYVKIESLTCRTNIVINTKNKQFTRI